MIEIDACSKPCPQPVIETKKAMEANPGVILNIIVDDEAAKVNVTRFANSKNYNVEEKDLGGKKVKLKLTPPESSKKESEASSNKSKEDKNGTVFFLNKYIIGGPDRELGKLLAKTFFQTLKEVEEKPQKIVFMHGGVKHTVEGSDTLKELKKVESLGVDLVVCGTCLDYYGLKDKIAVGRISNFFEIASILGKADNTVTL